MRKHLLTLITFFGKPLQYLRVQLRKLRGKASHCCTFRRHLQFAVEKFGLIFAPATDHALTHSILASNLRVLFHSFCVSNNFELESHIVRSSAYLWHDEYEIDWLLTLVSGCSLVWVMAFILKFFQLVFTIALVGSMFTINKVHFIFAKRWFFWTLHVYSFDTMNFWIVRWEERFLE